MFLHGRDINYSSNNARATKVRNEVDKTCSTHGKDKNLTKFWLKTCRDAII